METFGEKLHVQIDETINKKLDQLNIEVQKIKTVARKITQLPGSIK